MSEKTYGEGIEEGHTRDIWRILNYFKIINITETNPDYPIYICKSILP